MCVNDEIMIIDEVDTKEGYSLRGMIMDLVYPRTNIHLFYCVFKNDKFNKIHVSFPPAHAKMATMIANSNPILYICLWRLVFTFLSWHFSLTMGTISR